MKLMKKGECEKEIRRLCHEWAKEVGIPIRPVDQPHFSEFKSWLRARGDDRYLNFRSERGAEDDAEDWFDDEFGQSWRN